MSGALLDVRVAWGSAPDRITGSFDDCLAFLNELPMFTEEELIGALGSALLVEDEFNVEREGCVVSVMLIR